MHKLNYLLLGKAGCCRVVDLAIGRDLFFDCATTRNADDLPVKRLELPCDLRDDLEGHSDRTLPGVATGIVLAMASSSSRETRGVPSLSLMFGRNPFGLPPWMRRLRVLHRGDPQHVA